ncbi:MFS transporter [Conexibacter stalactiti]|uniref:MFS transporter n=1 Tax=Conexibacter stalactiti TaxID=1940611 RepID=A0ABU4HJR8_9ACTN|nr:MFS transporter [Conexibacter stalactiti]MDW5593559.1 MFS transporter [Conexibacter stalactiti]MEC5034200.1 MFS transporter [Conexibacter stalactiti]
MPADATPQDPRRFLILGICCLSLFVVGIDTTAVNIALPSIRSDLDTSVAQLQWTIDAYTLTLASLLLLAGATADRVGRARVFKVGLALFTLGSLLCSVAPSAPLLIAARALQAVGGSMLNPVAMSIVRNTFTDARERAQAIGVWGGTIGVSMALGPVLGGLLVEAVGWRAIFWVNVPIGIAAIVLTARYVPESRASRARRPDPLGQALVIVLLGTLTYAIIEAPSHGWLTRESVALFSVAAGALAALVSWELRRRDPLIEMRFFRSAPFAGATAIAVAAFAGLGGFLFLNTLYLQEARGLSPLTAGLWTLPMAALTVVCGPLSGRLVGRVGARPSLVVGGAAMTLAGLLLTELSSTTPVWLLFCAYVLFGLGFGFVNPPITNTAVSGMPADQAGVAAAIASTSRQIGATLGVAVVGAVAIPAAAFADAADVAAAGHVGWWIVAGCGALVLALGLATTSRWANATAARTALALREGAAT